jgi:hypothetical protein
MYDRAFQLRCIPNNEANPGSARTQFESFQTEQVWKVVQKDVEEWIAHKFKEDPNEFLKNDTQLLVVEALETPE